jgi:hypothetical protein
VKAFFCFSWHAWLTLLHIGAWGFDHLYQCWEIRLWEGVVMLLYFMATMFFSSSYFLFFSLPCARAFASFKLYLFCLSFVWMLFIYIVWDPLQNMKNYTKKIILDNYSFLNRETGNSCFLLVEKGNESHHLIFWSSRTLTSFKDRARGLYS